VHLRSTHGVLVRIYPDDSVPTDPQDSRAPGLSGITRVIVATTDASLAANAYDRGFGLDVDLPRHDDERGVLSVEARVPKGAVIELVSAVNTDTPFAREIERCVKERNGGMYSLVLRAADP
jgi:hypothetical protein